jgi:HlyD family secretion protein/macrolide-specific efflux system membrane fusion protein
MKILRWLKFWKLPKKIWIPLLLAIPVLLYFAFKPTTPKEPTVTTVIKKTDIRSTISGSGTLTGANSATLKFGQGGKLAYINIKDGDRVKKGQIIAGLDTKEISINLQQARNTYTAKDATAKRAEDEAKGNDDDETFEQKEDRVLAQVDRDNAYDAMKKAEREFEDAVIVSPIAGIVTQASPLAGQTVSAADTIAQIVDDSGIYFEAEIDETDIGQIKSQMMAEITLDAYPDQIFKGIVEKIVPTTKTTDSGATVVIAKINLNSPNLTFVNGLNGQADVITTEISNVLTIPQDALREDGTVYIKEGNEYKIVKVETGLYSDEDVEIKSGLTENQEVVTNPGSIIPPSNNPITKFIQNITQKK